MSATLPIGPLVNAHPADRPERVTLKGRWITLVPLDAAAHAEALYEGSNGDAAREAVWTYLFDGPYTSLDEFRANLEAKARSTDPLFFVVIDNSSGRALGYQTLMRIDAANRVVEVGNIMYTPAMQRTAGATEAQYLLARYVFDELGDRRYEMPKTLLQLTDANQLGRKSGIGIFDYSGETPKLNAAIKIGA